MDMESRRRVLARRRRRRQRQLRRRLACGAAVFAGVCAAVGVYAWAVRPGGVGESGLIWPGSNGVGAGEICLAGRDDAGVSAGTLMDGTLTAQESRKSIFDVFGVGMDENSESADLTARETTVALATELENEIELPERFDLREQDKLPAVPDQGTFGTCWAFASISALESSMTEELRQPLSADHMSIKNSFGLGQDDGGDYSISSSYLLSWQGPVAEADDPYGDGQSPDGLEPVCHVQEIQILGEKDFDAIKRAVYMCGGVQSSFYMPQAAGAERDRYYKEETSAFYYDGTREANHDVVIVGWDDAYPKENFARQPEHDGAFLCMNTWGEGFGEQGYFYISYEDSRIGMSNVSYTGVESIDNYDVIYQTDLCGWTGQLGYGTSEAWFANVYEAEAAGTLDAAGFYATVPDVEYRVYVAAAGEMFADRELVAEGHLANAGFYTIRWQKEIPLEAGEWFAVIVEINSPETTEPVAVEYQAGLRTANVDISDGEGYISPDGVNWQRAETEQECNVCLKAYGSVTE